MVPSGTVAASKHGGSFLARISWISLYLCPVYDVCSYRVLPSSSGGQLGAVTIACVLLVSGTSLISNWEVPYLAFGLTSYGF